MIATIGEALIDFIYQDDGKNPVYRPVPGGSPYNTSIAMARLGLPVSFLSPISMDIFGKMLIEHLDNNAVNTDSARRSDNPTTLAFAKIVKGKAEYAFFSNGSADRNVSVEDLEKALDQSGKSPDCYQIGSISLLLEPGATEIYTFLKKHSKDSVVSFDPNIRQSLVTDRDWYLERLKELLGISDIIKISDEDMEWIFPGTSISEGAEKILAYGPAVCVVTAGKHGVHWFSKSAGAFLEARDISITDTIGAGDTFHGGLLAYFFWSGNLERKKLEVMTSAQARTALQYASLAAEINCTREGANPPTKSEHTKEMLSVYGVDTAKL